MKCTICGMDVGDKRELVEHLAAKHKEELKKMIMDQLRWLERKSHKRIIGKVMKCPLCGPGALLFGRRYTIDGLSDHIIKEHKRWIVKGLKL